VYQLNIDLNLQTLRNGHFNVSETNPSRRWSWSVLKETINDWLLWVCSLFPLQPILNQQRCGHDVDGATEIKHARHLHFILLCLLL
jgi:hypothetical protein